MPAQLSSRSQGRGDGRLAARGADLVIAAVSNMECGSCITEGSEPTCLC